MGPLLGNLLSLRFGTDWDERLKNAGPGADPAPDLPGRAGLLRGPGPAAAGGPGLEDLHWADSLSLDLISLLMEALTLAPLLLLCVYRPEREHRCWHLGTIAARKCAGALHGDPPARADAAQSRRLVESLLTIENLPAAVKELILEKSRGNPFFVEEVVRSLIDCRDGLSGGRGLAGAGGDRERSRCRRASRA